MCERETACVHWCDGRGETYVNVCLVNVEISGCVVWRKKMVTGPESFLYKAPLHSRCQRVVVLIPPCEGGTAPLCACNEGWGRRREGEQATSTWRQLAGAVVEGLSLHAC